MKDAMTEGAQGAECVQSGIRVFVSRGQEEGTQRPLLRVKATRLRASASRDWPKKGDILTER